MVKQEVLAALDAARGRYISGQELAAQLDVSRTAVWKAVAALRRDGIPIKAVTNRGYTLAQSVDVLNAAAVAAQLDEATVKALQIEVVAAVDTALGADALPYYTFFDADTKLDWQHRVRAITEKALYDTGVMPEYGAQLLTLSTCGDTHPDTDARFALLAVRID